MHRTSTLKANQSKFKQVFSMKNYSLFGGVVGFLGVVGRRFLLGRMFTEILECRRM